MDSLELVREKFYAIAEELGFELVELNGLNLGGRKIIRAFIHRPGGVTISDCKTFSRACSDYLDIEDVIHGKYTLEVSSLGLDRPLLKPEDFRRRLKENITLELKPGSYSKNVVEGNLVDADEIGVNILADSQVLHFMFEQIVRGKIIL
jgi:ribosome maturation factor RimP